MAPPTTSGPAPGVPGGRGQPTSGGPPPTGGASPTTPSTPAGGAQSSTGAQSPPTAAQQQQFQTSLTALNDTISQLQAALTTAQSAAIDLANRNRNSQATITQLQSDLTDVRNQLNSVLLTHVDFSSFQPSMDAAVQSLLSLHTVAQSLGAILTAP